MGNKASLCGKTNQAGAYTDSYQSTSVSSVHSNLKKSFVKGQLSKDNFKILKVIGRGSFGKVFLVEKKATLSPMSIEASMHRSGLKGSARSSPSGDSGTLN
jgi:serine/threonine protein kinase